MKVIRRDYGQGAGKDQEQNIDGDTLLLDRLIYKRMSSLTQNKNILSPVTFDTDFNRWLLDMNNLHNRKYYPTLAATLPEPTPDLIALDEYLGTLGEGLDYPFLQDTYAVEPWVVVDTRNTTRVIAEYTDTEQIILMDGADVLVSIAL